MRLTDRAAIRARLEQDRAWAVYALGDLEPGYFEHCEWHAAAVGPALVLLYRALSRPVLYAQGTPEAVRPLLGEVSGEPEVYLLVRPDVVPLIRERWSLANELPMWRMALQPEAFRPAGAHAIQRLGPDDLPALRRLYADGQAAGDEPDLFTLESLAHGVFFGAREGPDLIAAAGTHVVSEVASAAAIGSVYTRRDRRGQGWATRVTSAVAAELLRRGLRTVALNVSRHNPAAIRAYTKIGFEHYCPFVEGLAIRPAG